MPEELLLVGNEIGVGPIDALNKFSRRLRPTLNVLGFYQGASPAHAVRGGWAGLERKELRRYELPRLISHQIHPRKNAVQLAVNVLGSARNGELDSVLASALELHNLAISSTDLRVQFVTMWSAVECLSSTVAGESVISRVMNLLVPIVSWRRLEKEIRYLGLNLRQWREQNSLGKSTSNALPNATPKEVPGEDVLMTVTRPKDHAHILELLNMVGAHPLLLWRTTTVWEEFHDPKTLAKELERSRERLEWHLGRIYRARNRLAHEGNDSPMLGLLLGNLQFYFSTTVSRLLHGVARDPRMDTAQSAAHWLALADKVRTQLIDTPANLTVGDIMSNPRLRADQSPWGAR